MYPDRLLPRVAVCLASFWAAGPAVSQEHSSSPDFGRPNIVVILADDFGYGSSGCYGADSDLVRTPSIDRLRARVGGLPMRIRLRPSVHQRDTPC